MAFRLVTVSDIQGDWDCLNEISKFHSADVVLHTGNFGFWDLTTVQSADLQYLKLLVAFLPLLPSYLVSELNELSQINKTDNFADLEILHRYRHKLCEHGASHLEQYLDGTKQFEFPVYTIIGPLDDPNIVLKFLNGEFSIPNLHIVDHKSVYELETAEMPIRIYGLGGNLKIHSLFDEGDLSESETRDSKKRKSGLGANGGEFTEVTQNGSKPTEISAASTPSQLLCGRLGDLWITLPQIATLYSNVTKKLSSSAQNGINIFLSHSPVVKNPLLEHLAIVTKADFTISQGLHFRYPVSGNGMSFVDSMGGSAGYIDTYRHKFLRLRMILGEMWEVVRDDVCEVLDGNSHLLDLVELGLSLFDKIPVTVSELAEKIVKLSLDDSDDEEISKLTLRRILDMYFAAYYKLWHFNLCDHTSEQETEVQHHNVMVFALDRGYFKLAHCNSEGFSFSPAELPPETASLAPSYPLAKTRELLRDTQCKRRGRKSRGRPTDRQR